MVSNGSRRPFVLVANHIVLDFTNTVNARPTFSRDDLAHPDDIVDWACAAGMVEGLVEGSADGGVQEMRRHVGATELDEAVALRENLYGVFGPIAAGREPRAASVTYVSQRAADAIRSSRLIRGEAGFALAWPPNSVESLVHRLADEALCLLRSPEARRGSAPDPARSRARSRARSPIEHRCSARRESTAARARSTHLDARARPGSRCAAPRSHAAHPSRHRRGSRPAASARAVDLRGPRRHRRIAGSPRSPLPSAGGARGTRRAPTAP